MTCSRLFATSRKVLGILCALFFSFIVITTRAEANSLVHSLTADRAGSIPMEGATVSGDVYGRITPESGISTVHFYLDGSSSYFKYESTAPYDLNGGASSAANPYDTTSLSDGQHTIRAKITLTAGGAEDVYTTFTVNNNGTPNTAPAVTVTSGSSTGSVGSSMSFMASASDIEDGDLSSSIHWSSDLDGALGSGGTLTTSSLTQGTHTLTASVTDSGSLSGSDTHSVTISAGGGSGSCGSLTQEAENGTLFGDFVTVNDGTASDGQYVHVPPDTTSTTSQLTGDYVEYCFNVVQAGTYQVIGTARAASGSYNSFHVTVNGSPTSGHAWAFTDSSGFVTEAISGGNGSGAIEEFALSTGDNTVRFYLREDGAQLDKVSLELQGGANTAPVLNSIGNQTATVGSAQSIPLSASDAESDTLSYTIGGVPSFVSLSGSTLSIDSNSSTGSYTITVTVSDGNGGSDSETFTLTVSSSGGGTTTIDPIVTDNSDINTSQTGSWSTSSNTPPWASDSLFSTTAGTFVWTPSVVTDAEYHVYAWWTQHANRTQSAPYTITHANGSETITVDQSDVNKKGQWNLLGTYDFTAGNATLVLTSSADNGRSFSADAIKLVAVTSGGTAGNSPPVLNTIGNQNVTAGSGQTINLSASDADGDTLAYTLTGPPSFVSLTDHGDGTATLAVSSASTAGIFSMSVIVSDGTDTVSESFALTVDAVGTPQAGDCTVLAFPRTNEL